MEKELTGFTNIQKLDPEIIVDLKYATPDNFTGKVVYDFQTAIARTGTAKKLAHASKLVKDQGYRLKIWDAYRPVSAQKRLFEVYPDPKFVAKPNPNFSHQKGVTFDLTLTQEEHYQILDKAKTEAGFVGYVTEWWDYRDSQMDEYEPLLADPNDYKM